MLEKNLLPILLDIVVNLSLDSVVVDVLDDGCGVVRLYAIVLLLSIAEGAIVVDVGVVVVAFTVVISTLSLTIGLIVGNFS